MDVRRGRIDDALMGAPLAVLAFLANMNFLRDPLAGSSAGCDRARGPRRRVAGRARAAGAVAAVAVARTHRDRGARARRRLVEWWSVGRTQEHLARTNLSLGVSSLPRLIRDRTAQLKARYDRQQLPDGRILSLVGLFDYLDRCTTPSHRLLVAGNAPGDLCLRAASVRGRPQHISRGLLPVRGRSAADARSRTAAGRRVRDDAERSGILVPLDSARSRRVCRCELPAADRTSRRAAIEPSAFWFAVDCRRSTLTRRRVGRAIADR